MKLPRPDRDLIALSVLALALAAQLVVVTIVATPLQELGYRWMAVAGISPLIIGALAVLATVAGGVELFRLRHRWDDNRLRAAAVIVAVLVSWVAVAVLAGPATVGIAGGSSADPDSVESGTEFTVMVQNLWYQHGDPDQIAEGTLGADADVVVLLEYTPEHQIAFLDHAEGDYPYRWQRPHSVGAGLAVFSRLPLGPAEDIDLSTGAVRMPVEAGPAEVDLVVVHTLAPKSFWGLQRWTSDMIELVRVGTTTGSRFRSRTVVAGDFNATRYHRRYREMLELTGLTDTLDAVGAGYAPTWPVGGRLPPLMRLDHILVGSDIAVLDSWLSDDFGSDHLGVAARLGVVGP